MSTDKTVCIVGQGPSAKGQGRIIDSADIVVRLKAFWAHGAEDVGSKLDILAWYGCPIGWDHPDKPELRCEYWITQSTEQWFGKGPRQLERAIHAEFAKKTVGTSTFHQLPHKRWRELARALRGEYPSTGFVAVDMAMNILKPEKLILFGYDATHPDREGWADARDGSPWTTCGHPMAMEKWMIAQITMGSWCGNRCNTQLEWPHMPETTREELQEHCK